MKCQFAGAGKRPDAGKLRKSDADCLEKDGLCGM